MLGSKKLVITYEHDLFEFTICLLSEHEGDDDIDYFFDIRIYF